MIRPICQALAAVSVLVATATPPLARESAQPHYEPPRTMDGRPDFQGVWTNASITTLERASAYSTLAIAPHDVARLTEEHPQNVRQRTDDGLVPTQDLLDGKDLGRGRGYNAFWIDAGTQFGLVKGEYRTSWIVDPANGKIPYSEQGRVVAAQSSRYGYDGPEARPLAERCIAVGGRVGPPMVNGAYNNNYQITQTDTEVVILVEMIEHARVIPLQRTQHLPSNMRPLFGDPLGHWEGDTLVVETTNFHPFHSQSANPALLSANGKVTERFTLVSATEIFYEFTVDDGAFYAQPWHGEMTFNRMTKPVYEYACHEGNYALTGVLAGAREQERLGKPVSATSDRE